MPSPLTLFFDAKYGDLCRSETFDLFRAALEQNILQGILAGPPCETWSEARGVRLEDGSKGPRVVRSNLRPCGILDLTRKEGLQVAFGSLLLSVAIKLMVVALMAGKTGLLEHPADLESEPHMVSIWKTAIIQTLLRFPGCRKFSVLQGYFGAKSKKPTNLLLVNVSKDAEQIFFDSRTTCLPSAVAIGRNDKNEWKTSELKAYPPGFCMALAKVSAASQCAPDCGMVVPKWFEEVISDMTVGFDYHARMGNDYGNRPDAF